MVKVFEATSQKVEVLGDSILSIVDGMGAFRPAALQILQSNGVVNPQKGCWYSQQGFLNAFRNISEKIGQNTLKAIGKTIPENALLPPGINSIESIFQVIDQAFHMNHRGGEIGHYSFKMTGGKSGKMLCSNAYPCAFDWGILTGFATKFKKEGNLVKVTHVDGPCRMKGGDSCEYEISW